MHAENQSRCNCGRKMSFTRDGFLALWSSVGYRHHNGQEYEKYALQGCTLCERNSVVTDFGFSMGMRYNILLNWNSTYSGLRPVLAGFNVSQGV
jgi:hypothetical protein